ncbi:bifunctional DNA-formamidopyrimidine glycosylase/DNA-(apurinic or apyrimidinic site) lyase [Candidatus Saccharibacteria bacterium]|nr:bifunctional DNA-formamidopyrimidine glycosylase/DNA-(apurinic or apyrimidinic site) lyase [Candidatus Saccharibacteria bacterium]
MPELPEVETIRSGLASLIVGKTIKKISHDTQKGFPNSEADVKQFALNNQIKAVRRRAKVLLIDLGSGYSFMIHLKMTGQIVVRSSSKTFGGGHPTDSLIGDLPDKSTRVTIEFTDSSKLFFNDQRKFGWMKLLPTAEIMNTKFMQRVGPEPLPDDFTPAQFKARFTNKQRSKIKAALLDQSVVAGIGNIYADESLFYAKIHPERLVGSLSSAEFKKLYTGVRATMNRAIASGGSTDRNYVQADGSRGNYLDKFAQVFRREGLPCPRCGHEIIKIRVAGRGTHICPNCQKNA